MTSNSEAMLKSFVDRMERLKEAQLSAALDVKELKQEIKSNGFDPKAIDRIVKERLMDGEKKAKARETEENYTIYTQQLGFEL